MREQMRAGTPHGGEIAYVFGTLSRGCGGAPTPEDLSVSRLAQSYWVNFATTGDPNGMNPASVRIFDDDALHGVPDDAGSDGFGIRKDVIHRDSKPRDHPRRFSRYGASAGGKLYR
jgi:carboxylesterase family protein